MTAPVPNSSALPVNWHKSRYSGTGNCLEIATLQGATAVRDSKNPTGPALLFPDATWSAFVASTRHSRRP